MSSKLVVQTQLKHIFNFQSHIMDEKIKEACYLQASLVG